MKAARHFQAAKTQLSNRAKLFIAAVVSLGLLAIGHSVYSLFAAPVSAQWFILAALTLLSGSITVKLPSVPATISVSETFVFTSVLLFGTPAGTITVTLDGLIISLWLQRKHLELHKLAFNTTAPALSVWIASNLFFWITECKPLTIEPTSISGLLPGFLLFAVTYFLLNSWLMAAAVSLENTLTAIEIWRKNFLWLSLNFLSGASVAILLVSLNREVNLAALAVIVPLLVISYLTYHTSMGRVADANRHVDDLNQLYLSTIETLAMAIDAKDQVTHGHIRRVQARSVALARRLGVKDEYLLKAIEAASLLHDMGKLAIPEHILNKPGKLNPAEFEIMKVHASVGADILSAVEFPYPVVPIVRHHHESWNGTGYPDGLSSTDIPIGARILAVVDCFDALTSDRPYRGRLTDTEALSILDERRGSMYDPLVVDAFIEMHADYDPASTELSHIEQVHLPIVNRPAPVLASPEAGWLGSKLPVSEAIFPYSVEVLASYLIRMAPGSLLVLWVVDENTHTLTIARAWGKEAHQLAKAGATMPLGKGLSGWVAVTGRAVYDADSTLDFFGEGLGRIDSQSWTSCSATPIVMEANVIGVLSMYLESPVNWSEDSGEQRLALTSAHMSPYLASFRRSA